MQARSTERRWSRALQHEHSLRLKLQENMEALASQMQLLEDEARQSVQGMLPSLHTVASHGSNTCMVSEVIDSTSSTSTLEGKKMAPKKLAVALDNSLSETDGKLTESPEEDDEKFFDAPEIFAGESKKFSAPIAVPPDGASVGHRRNVSASSVNDVSSMRSSEPEVKEICPHISTDRRMAVRRKNSHIVSCHTM